MTEGGTRDPKCVPESMGADGAALGALVSSATLATVSRTAGVTPSLAAAPNTGAASS